MNKQTPLSKQSKRVQKEHNSARRGDWGEIKPVLRVVESRKKYSRNRLKDADRSGKDAD